MTDGRQQQGGASSPFGFYRTLVTQSVGTIKRSNIWGSVQPVGASTLAMDVNDNARNLDERATRTIKTA